MRVVLDTNVIVSGLNFEGNERQVLILAVQRRFDLFLSPFIFQETGQVLRRKFYWTDEQVERAFSALQRTGNVIDPPEVAGVLESDPDDNRILDCAAEVSADYLVTGDRRHLLPLGEYAGTRIVTTVAFLDALEGDS